MILVAYRGLAHFSPIIAEHLSRRQGDFALELSNGVRAAVAGWSKTLPAEVGRHSVTVNMIPPGRIDTDRVRELDGFKAERSTSSVEAVQEASCPDIPVG